MNKFFKYFLIVVLFSAWGAILTNKEQVRETARETIKSFQKPCSKPIEYSVGQVDEKFGISGDRFREVVLQSEGIWELQTGKNLFQYNPNAKFKINLIFDQRQANTIESENMEKNLGNLESSYSMAEKEYNSLSAAYKQKVDNYQDDLAEYKKELDKFNEKVAYWNERGGAPEDEYDDLKDDKADLDKMFSKLEKERKELNILGGKTNTLADKSNALAQNYNNNLYTYKSKFGAASQFDKGVYEGDSITVYQFYGESDLRLTLAHEFGHALGLDHVENPKSLMYYLMGEQDIDDPKLSEEDISAINVICGAGK
jgi:hypothetical protein